MRQEVDRRLARAPKATASSSPWCAGARRRSRSYCLLNDASDSRRRSHGTPNTIKQRAEALLLGASSAMLRQVASSAIAALVLPSCKLLLEPERTLPPVELGNPGADGIRAADGRIQWTHRVCESRRSCLELRTVDHSLAAFLSAAARLDRGRGSSGATGPATGGRLGDARPSAGETGLRRLAIQWEPDYRAPVCLPVDRHPIEGGLCICPSRGMPT